MTAFEVRFWAKVAKSDGCWLWIGSSDGQYGSTKRDGRWVKAHRVAYELAGGEIPEGFVLDHLCRTTLCVRPSHLEPVTHRENLARGNRGGYRLRLDLSQTGWRAVLRDQGRTMRWLATQTGRTARTIYAYSRGQLVPPASWLAEVSRLLGQEVAA